MFYKMSEVLRALLLLIGSLVFLGGVVFATIHRQNSDELWYGGRLITVFTWIMAIGFLVLTLSLMEDIFAKMRLLRRLNSVSNRLLSRDDGEGFPYTVELFDKTKITLTRSHKTGFHIDVVYADQQTHQQLSLFKRSLLNLLGTPMDRSQAKRLVKALEGHATAVPA